MIGVERSCLRGPKGGGIWDAVDVKTVFDFLSKVFFCTSCLGSICKCILTFCKECVSMQYAATVSCRIELIGFLARPSL